MPLDGSVAPSRDAFARPWPEARTADLLDVSLLADLAAAGHPDAAVLSTCSAFGPAIDAVRADLPIPVLRPDKAAYARALQTGRRIALVATFPPRCLR